jgi:predicted anti-sigma-YlaC factor YlaD
VRCEEARPLLLKGEHAQAEDHLLTCEACFNWLEAHDPLVAVLQAARPAPSPVPERLAPALVQRWQPHRVSLRLGIAAAMALSLLGLALSAISVLAAPALAASLLVSIGDVAATVQAVIDGLIAVPRALLLDQPLALAAFTAATVAVCALWARLYQQSQLPRRVPS